MPDLVDITASIKYRLRSVRSAWALIRNPAFVTPGHFYSPLTSSEDRRRAKQNSPCPPIGIDLNPEGQRALFETFDQSDPTPSRWKPSNDQFGPADAMIYREMLRLLKPHRVVEIGSGHSTALALDTADEFDLAFKLTCIEPYPARLLSVLRSTDKARLELLVQQVQDVSASDLVSNLQPNDILFIDSSHVLKSGSDVAWLYLHVLPVVPRGVYVHIHDIYWPFEYLDSWLDERRDWTEIYLLQAFLTENSMWEISLFGDWALKFLSPTNQALRQQRTGSFWMRRK